MGLLVRLVNNLTSANAEKLQGMVPLGEITTVNNLPEARQISSLANVPNLKACNESRALRAYKEAETVHANGFYQKEIAKAQASKIDAHAEAVRVRLGLRSHAMKTVARLAKEGADHRLEGLAMGYGIAQQKARVSAWEQVSNVSAEVIQF